MNESVGAPGRHRRVGARTRRWLRWAPRIVLLSVCLAAGVLTLVPAALGYQRYVITGGSMTGTIDKGSLVYDAVVPVTDLRVGDVITYEPPPGTTPDGGLVTHRIISIEHGDDGRLVFRTKGDANQAADPWRFHLDDVKQARVSYVLPHVGYAFAALAIPAVRSWLIGGIAGLLALRVCWALWRDAGRWSRAQQRTMSAEQDAAS